MLTALLDHLWQSTLLAACAGILTLLLRRNGAHVRYWLWLAASVKFLVPFSLLATLGGALAALGGRLAIHPHALAQAPSLALFVQRAAAPFLAATPALAAPTTVASIVSVALLGVWAGGFVVIMTVRLVRLRRLASILRTAQPMPIAAPIPVMASRSSIEPGLVGIRRPVLLIPEGLLAHLSAAEMRAIVAHELCHLRRRDNLTAAVHMLVEALLWFYPLVWWLGARLIAERERACDESVLASGNDAPVYAEGILKVCKFHVRSPLACAAGVSGADLSERLETIMNGCKTTRLTAARKWLLAAAGTAALAVPLLAGLLSAPSEAATGAGTAPNAASAAPTPAEIAQRRYDQARPRTAVPFNPADFDKYVGHYQLSPTVVFDITRGGSHYFAQLTGQPRIEIYPDSSTEFFYKVVPAQLTFVSGAQGRVTGLVLHQNGLLLPAKRVDAATAANASAALKRRIESNTPSPGTEAAVRRFIAEMERGQPNYAEMSPMLAAAARAQAPLAASVFKHVGAFESLKFQGVAQGGADVYDAAFAHGRLEFRIAPLGSDGKIKGLGFRPLP